MLPPVAALNPSVRRHSLKVSLLTQVNIQGDFNLTALDLLPEAGLYWVGNCNELNAGNIPTTSN